MKSPWAESYDGDKDRRFGLLFFVAILGFFGAVVLGAILFAVIGPDYFRQYGLPALPGSGILLIAFGWRWIRRERKRRRERLKYAALSRDELVKARAKLRNKMQPARRVMTRAPDLDLKY